MMRKSDGTAGLSPSIASAESGGSAAVEESIPLLLEPTRNSWDTLGMGLQQLNDSFDSSGMTQDQQSGWTMTDTGINPSVLSHPESYGVQYNGGVLRALEPALRLPPVEICKGDTTDVVYRLNTTPHHDQVQGI